MERFKTDLGVNVYITEFDVKVHGLDGDREPKLERQALIYRYMIRAALASGACRGISFFGASGSLHVDV